MEFVKMVDNMIASKDLGDITPLLKSYDALSTSTKFLLPTRAILDYDKKVF